MTPNNNLGKKALHLLALGCLALAMLPAASASLYVYAEAHADCNQRGKTAFYDASADYYATASASWDEVGWQLTASGMGYNMGTQNARANWPFDDGTVWVSAASGTYVVPRGTAVHSESHATATSSLHAATPADKVANAPCTGTGSGVHCDLAEAVTFYVATETSLPTSSSAVFFRPPGVAC
jgi:hypothetical protein